MSYDFQSFISIKGWEILYQKGKTIDKAFSVIQGYLRRIALLFRVKSYDFVLIHRELTPFGPPIFEWIIAKVLRKKIIYDYDDAIWLADQESENPLWKILKWRSKVASICRWSWKVTAGNQYLAQYARKQCQNVVILPTVVDTNTHHASFLETKPDAQKITIGWTGSHSTLFYLNDVIPVLQELEQSYDFEFLVIANKDPHISLTHFRFIPWNKHTEIEDLSKIDIGIMPLEDTEWAKGKCGFKLIQYLAIGIPAVANDVGVNNQLILEEETGFLADSHEKWLQSLKKLLTHKDLRKQMGSRGRDLIEKEFSVESQKEKFLSLFHV